MDEEEDTINKKGSINGATISGMTIKTVGLNEIYLDIKEREDSYK